MKYWLLQGKSLEAASAWRKEAITTKHHMSVGSLKITVQQWIGWRKVTSLAEAAAWLAKGFTPTTAAPWVDHNVSPEAAAHLQQNITPSKAAEWLKTGIDFRVLIEWRKAIPCATEAAAFLEEKFSPAKAATWFELKILAPEATCFRSIGWVPDTVVTWLNTNETTYDKIRKYFHPNIGPENAIVWKQRGFAPVKQNSGQI
ncbi:hypothetical protein DSO57_1006344 [Entomophthora muscae]|uniref:Uncharacterized protein n=1 Tax=Entomophthora muscae TaxID=34485 RepID=A0ACC2U5G2_9FUNG|nr:hypothetical protein DSO57_1006344 [Entomophthora muscae]